MEALAALALAGNIVQFAQFMSQLMKDSSELHASSVACTTKILELETLYGHLHELNSTIEKGLHDASAYISSPTTESFKDLSTLCKEDCAKLLGTVSKLRLQKGSKGRWKSFRAALQLHWKKGEIKDMEERLQKIESTMTLHICTMASLAHKVQASQLEVLQEASQRLQCDQLEKFDRILAALKDIEVQVHQVGHREANPFSSLSGEVKSLEQRFSSLSISRKAIAKEQNILKSLEFPSRPMRHRGIPEAHQKTFEWVFHPQGDSLPAAGSLGIWLKSSHGIFWVAGKPGSGKSTFMKFVAGERRTRDLLSHWAAEKPIALASHYFWSAGSSLQKSAEGLLRALLYDMFRQCVEVRELICTQVSRQQESNWDGGPSWDQPNLQAAIQLVASQKELSARFCFFIDGLDEYDGDQLELCETLKGLAACDDIKICLSSRPWNVFEDAFGSSSRKKLYMQDLNRNDIVEYTRSRMSEHPRWPSLIKNNPSQGEWLIEEVGDRSCGVFLWVFLVTNRLREGMTNRDSFLDIRRRLESIPIELETFFKQILSSVDSFYHDKMSTMLQVAVEAKEPLPARAYSFLEKEHDDSDYIFQLPVRPYTPGEEEESREQTAWRLDSRTRGLLEMDQISGSVTFIHRTVMDFLRTQEMAEYLASKSPSGFHIICSLLKIYTAMIKTDQFDDPVSLFPGSANQSWQEQHESPTRWQSFTASILSLAGEIGNSSPASDTAFRVFNELDQALLEMFVQNQARVVKPGYSPEFFFRSQLLDGMNADYLSTRLRSDRTFFACLGHLAIPFMLTNKNRWAYVGSRSWGALQSFAWDYDNRNLKTLRLVLETQDLDPNAYDSDDLKDLSIRSPWAWLLREMAVIGCQAIEMSDKEFWELIQHDIISLMLRRGANRKVVIRCQGARTSGLSLYMCRGWRTPPTNSHKEKYLQGLRDFLVEGAALTQIFNCFITNHLAALAGKNSSELLPNDWRVMIESVEIVLGYMNEKGGVKFRFRGDW